MKRLQQLIEKAQVVEKTIQLADIPKSIMVTLEKLNLDRQVKRAAEGTRFFIIDVTEILDTNDLLTLMRNKSFASVTGAGSNISMMFDKKKV